jgi:hypothetical protein
MNRKYLIALVVASGLGVAIGLLAYALGLSGIGSVVLGTALSGLLAVGILYALDRRHRAPDYLTPSRRSRERTEFALLEPVTRGEGPPRADLQPVRVVRVDPRSSRRLARRRARRHTPDYVRVHVAVEPRTRREQASAVGARSEAITES